MRRGSALCQHMDQAERARNFGRRPIERRIFGYRLKRGERLSHRIESSGPARCEALAVRSLDAVQGPHGASYRFGHCVEDIARFRSLKQSERCRELLSGGARRFDDVVHLKSFSKPTSCRCGPICPASCAGRRSARGSRLDQTRVMTRKRPLPAENLVDPRLP